MEKGAIKARAEKGREWKQEADEGISKVNRWVTKSTERRIKNV